MKTYNELIEIAKQKKVKHYRRYKKHELEKIFEFEATHGEEKFYEKYCKGKWIIKPVLVKNSNGEEKRFKSLYAAGKHFDIFPQTVKWRILEKKTLKLSNGVILSFFFQKQET